MCIGLFTPATCEQPPTVHFYDLPLKRMYFSRSAEASRDSGLEHGRRDRDHLLRIGRYAKYNNHWNTELPKRVYLQLVPAAGQQQHPASLGR